MRIARWMLGWGDRLPLSVLIGGHTPSGEEHPGLTPGRDGVFISLRDVVTSDRNEARRRFRVLAPKIADRYLARMDLFAGRSIQRFQLILDEARPEPPKDLIRTLEKRIEKEARARQIPDSVGESLKTKPDPTRRSRMSCSR
ncbi:MAG: hypothetical protein IPI35_27185 [Deltaproteobacteria bacterium]|nr:hypothetical protein [Deltaproteobacteria bacterium]